MRTVTMRTGRKLLGLAVCAGALGLAGCYEDNSSPDPELMNDAEAGEDEQQRVANTTNEATAELEPASGSDVTGTVTFETQENGVLVYAEIEGLSAGDKHGFHVHENGDCSAPDASSAGGHYNPHNREHGAPGDDPGERHVGDLGNVEADDEGFGEYQRVDPVITLGGANSILGKAVVVHSGEDDLTSQPSGDAGERLACGVIEGPDDGQGA